MYQTYTSDRQCTDTTVCDFPATEYTKQDVTMYTDRICWDLFECYPFQFESLAPTASLTGSARHTLSASRTFNTRLPLLPTSDRVYQH